MIKHQALEHLKFYLSRNSDRPSWGADQYAPGNWCQLSNIINSDIKVIEGDYNFCLLEDNSIQMSCPEDYNLYKLRSYSDNFAPLNEEKFDKNDIKSFQDSIKEKDPIFYDAIELGFSTKEIFDKLPDNTPIKDIDKIDVYNCLITNYPINNLYYVMINIIGIESITKLDLDAGLLRDKASKLSHIFELIITYQDHLIDYKHVSIERLLKRYNNTKNFK